MLLNLVEYHWAEHIDDALLLLGRLDVKTALIALNAEIVVRSSSKTQVNLSGGTLERPGLALSGVVYRGKQERRIPSTTFALDRRPSELIIEVNIPKTGTSCGASMARIA